MTRTFFSIAALILAGTSVGAQEAPLEAPTASQQAPLGGVKQTSDGVCMEPTHPDYATQEAVARHPSMRMCVAAGGRRDAPRDALSLPGSLASSPANPLSQGAASSHPEDMGLMPGPSFAPLGGSSNTVPNLLNLGPLGSSSPTPDLPINMEGPESENLAPPAPARPPRGIEITDTPSYSEHHTSNSTAGQPQIFLPPSVYIGRGPAEFLP